MDPFCSGSGKASGDGRVEDAGEDPGTLYSALYRVFCDQDQEVCPLILPKVNADKPRIGKDGIFADEEDEAGSQSTNPPISLTC